MDFSGRTTRISGLYGAAQSYYFLGYSIIPIHGDSDPARAKVAAVSWQHFQQRRATPNRFQQWFEQQQFGGLAIVTGRISNLVVLDFDDARAADEFASRYPHLTTTRTVLSATRNLPHYYYHLPDSVSVASISGAGVDLQSDGRYIIAPPTRIADSVYKIQRGGQPHALTAAQARILESFVREQRSVTASQTDTSDDTNPPSDTCQQLAITVTLSVKSNQPETASTLRNDTPAEAQSLPFTPDDAQTLYKHHAARIGRNNALFKVALRLRDTGWTVHETLACLQELHVHQPGDADHPAETPEQRRREADRTIQSAYSRPPGCRKLSQAASENAESEKTPGLPNSVREAFLQRKQGYLVRVLDALLMEGAQPGQLVTEKIIVAALDGSVGRYSVLKALKATYHDKSSVFRVYEGEISLNSAENTNACSNKAPSPGTPTPADAASAIAEDTNNKCLLFRATASDKNKRGRPPTYYVIPHIEAMCAHLDVKYTHSDPLKTDDLQSMKKYRQGLEREFIKRAPGLYPRRWLANRLGISVRTSQRYRQEMPIKQREMFFRRLITWDNVDSIPDSDEPEGIFLEDDTGKRYPPVRSLAAGLLAQGRTVFLLHQDVNYYWHPETAPGSLAAMGIHPKEFATTQRHLFESDTTQTAQPSFKPLKIRQSASEAHLKPLNGLSDDTIQPNAADIQTNKHGSATASQVTKPPETPESVSDPLTAHTKDQIAEPFKPKSDRYYRRELPCSNAEYYAMKLYRRTHSLCELPRVQSSGSLSKVSARRLTHQYGYQLVKKLIQVLTWRDNIENPAGFAVIWLRSTSKSLDYRP